MTAPNEAPSNDLQRKVSVQFVRMTGAFAVEANYKSKAPVSGWSPRDNNLERSENVLSRAMNSQMNLGIHLCGPIVDVDVDNDDPLVMHALEMFLPPSGHIWGRPSRLKTHRVYRLSNGDFQPAENSRLLTYIKKEHHVELRGGEASRGQYSLLPSSKHPDGEDYQWHDLHRAQATPTQTTQTRLISGLRKAVAAAVLARHWVEGSRNDLTMALTGALYRMHAVATAPEEAQDVFTMDHDEALDFVMSVCRLADDDPSDMQVREKTFRLTWKKAEGGASVTGATRLAEICGEKSIVNVLYKLLTDATGAEKIDEFMERFAIRLNTTDVIDLEALSHGAVRSSTMTRQAFAQSYGFEKVLIGGKAVRVVDLFFDLPAVQRISGIDIDPEKPPVFSRGRELVANSWAGHAIKPWSDPVSEDDIAPFLYHVRSILAAGNPDYAHWILAWSADIFQRPNHKPGTALVLVGPQGAGKSLLGHGVLLKIIGHAHSNSTNSVDRITHSFNRHFANKLLIQCDEAINNKQKAVAAKLKSIVTDPTIHIEPKGVDGWDQTNLARFVFTSNEIDDAIFITDGLGDRRYAVFEVSGLKSKDLTFWDRYVDWLDVDDNLAKVHRYLLDYKYDPKEVRRAPVSKAKINMVQQSSTQFDDFMSYLLDDNFPLKPYFHTEPWHVGYLNKEGEIEPFDGIDRSRWPELVHLPTLLEQYTSFCSKMRRQQPEVRNESMFVQRLKGLMPDYVPTKYKVSYTKMDERTGLRHRLRPTLTTMPTQPMIEKFLESKYGMDPRDNMAVDVGNNDKDHGF